MARLYRSRHSWLVVEWGMVTAYLDLNVVEWNYKAQGFMDSTQILSNTKGHP